MNILDSLVDGALALPDRADADALIAAIVRYKRTGEEPQGLPPVAEAMWIAVRPVAAKNKALSDNASKGGEKSASKRSSQTPSGCESERVSRTASKSQSQTPNGCATEHSSSSSSPSSSSFEGNSTWDVVDGAPALPEPPEPEEVAAYFATNGLLGDPSEFYDHFSSQGWVRSNGQPVLDWRAQARLWSRRQREFDSGKPPELRAPVERLPVAENRRDYEAELTAMGAAPPDDGGGAWL